MTSTVKREGEGSGAGGELREVAVLVELAAALELAPAVLAAEVRPETLGAEMEETGVPVEVPEAWVRPALLRGVR